MTKEQVKQRILEVGIIPIVRAPSAQLAISAARAVCAGGIPLLEVTMTVPGAIDVISELARSIGNDVLIGAGTVLDADAARQCLEAGAQFLVAPGFDAGTVQFASREDRLILAGALTPTEVIAAWKAGSDIVKIFPCGNVGGPAYLKALKAPLPQIPMAPTGGVNLANAADFLRAGAAALGIGGELVSTAAMKSGDFASITETARQFAAIVKETRKLIQ